MADVALLGVAKRFGETVAVDDLTMNVSDGELVVLLGPTGAGKTTTLRLVAGLEQPDAGMISIAGREVTGSPPAARDVAFVFQQYSLYPHLSVFDNLAFPLRSPARRVEAETIRQRVTEIAALLHIEDKLQNRATQLSGGEMQRVAIGRALVRQPAIYLMDEPLSSLDAKLRAELRLELKRIQTDLGATLLYVTHDQIEAMTMADRIGVLQSGRLVQVGTPQEVYERPHNVYVASRLGTPRINLLPPDLLPADGQPADAGQVGARTEHIRILPDAAAPHTRPGKVDWIEHLGDQNHVHLQIDGHTLVSLVEPDSPLRVGDAVGVRLERPLFFDRAGDRIAHETQDAGKVGDG